MWGPHVRHLIWQGQQDTHVDMLDGRSSLLFSKLLWDVAFVARHVPGIRHCIFVTSLLLFPGHVVHLLRFVTVADQLL